MQEFQKGRYRVFVAKQASHLRASYDLRDIAFQAPNADRFDELSEHVLVEDTTTGTVLASFRMMSFPSGCDVGDGYSGQYYNLSKFKSYHQPMLEIGRFCTHPDCADPDLIRAAWAGVTRVVDAQKIGFLFGCASFEGTDPSQYSAGFAYLTARYLAPEAWRPDQKAEDVVAFADLVGEAGAAQIPPLLRGYLSLGGRVSDHAVVDRQMNTMHVFTGVDVDTISPARKRLLRVMSA